MSADGKELHVIYVPDGMSAEQVWEHISRNVHTPLSPEQEAGDEEAQFGRWTVVLIEDGEYRGERV